MPHPTFWFTNSGLKCSDIIHKLCCCYYKPLPLIEHISTDWDIDEVVSYRIVNIQKNDI
jgi:hypothetical protein